jgi:hypothetical protein
MPRPTYSFGKLAGVSTHYAREPIAPYGTRGVSYNFFCQKNTVDKLEAMFKDLWTRCPYGSAEVITSAGAYVEKAGWHGEGKAFDLDAIFWRDRAFVTNKFLDDPKFYLGVESVLRRHFGTILAYSYNSAHEDHFHLQDDGVLPGFSDARRSCILFVQNSLKFLRGATIKVNGSFDSATRLALEEWLSKLGIDHLNSDSNYIRFLDAVQDEAFGSVAGPLPTTALVTRTDLLRSVYESIETELGDTLGRKRVESALTTFAQSIPAELMQETLPYYGSKPITGPRGSAGEFSIDTNLKTTSSGLSAKQIDDYFLSQPEQNQKLAGIGTAVIEAARKYGINATYIVAHAILESGWGKSRISIDKNNLFGWSAFDSSPYNSATGFPSRDACIDFVMRRINEWYLDPQGKYFNTAPVLGSGYKPSGHGMNYFYASDNEWGPKIANIAARIEASI